jgi:hypothetical protein
MILPTPQHDPLFAEDGTSFRQRMIRYIEREFADVLGGRSGLLCSEEGLEALAALLAEQTQRRSFRNAA